jgi:hypothetical protein
MKKVAPIIMALLALLAFSGGSVFADHEMITVDMMEQNGSGQTGVATLTLSDDGMSITVEIDIASGEADVEQPAHIHPGTCANLDPKPLIPLNNVVNGKSVTVITDADVMGDVSGDDFAINVHKSKAEAAVYVSCGDIVETMVVGMPTTGGPSDNMAPMLAFAALALVATGTGISLVAARRKA